MALLAEIQAAPNEHVSFGRIPAAWVGTRLLGKAVSKQTRFADVYSAEWLSHLRRHLEPGLFARRAEAAEDFDLARLISQDRTLIQQIASIVHDLDFDGIYYHSRHGSNLCNWALFEPFELEYMPSEPITIDDPTLDAALRLLNLSLDRS
jgi:hypothetical protein